MTFQIFTLYRLKGGFLETWHIVSFEVNQMPYFNFPALGIGARILRKIKNFGATNLIKIMFYNIH